MVENMEAVITFFKKHWGKIFLSLFIVALICFVLIPYHSYFGEYFKPSSPYGYGELFRIYLTIVAGIIAIVALYYNHRRVTAMEKGNVDTRFNNAVGHLGDENPTVVLGGIHALHQIAVKHENYTQVIHNLFCSYLRENSAKLYDEEILDKCPVIIQTLIDYLFKPHNNKDSVYKDYASNLSFSTLKNCDFNHRVLANCHFNNAILTNCYFSNTTFINCYFLRTTLSDCKFMYASLTECVFTTAILTECNFSYATLFNCEFIKKHYFLDNSTQLINCDFRTTDLINTELPSNKNKQSETEN